MRKAIVLTPLVLCLAACGDAAIGGVPAVGETDAGCPGEICMPCEGDSFCPLSDPVCEDGWCRECAADAECKTQGLTLCTSSGRCGDCERDSQCPDDAPICNAAGECRGCQKHDDCDSLICEDTGRCADPGDVRYIDQSTGANLPTCGDAASPCGTSSYALSLPFAPPRWVRIASGDYTEATIAVSSATTIGFVLADDANLRAPGGHAFVVEDDSKLSVSGGRVDAPKNRAFDCSDSALTVTGTRVSAADVVVYASACDVAIQRSELTGAEFGVEVYGGSLQIAQSRIADQKRGSLFSWGASFVVENNFITKNTHVGGGYSIYLEAPHGGSRFRFNTVAANVVANDTYPGVLCQGLAIDAASNIVWNTNGRSIGGSSCDWGDSNLRDGSVLGWLDGQAPVFENPEGSDFRLAMSSPLIDAATQSVVERDFFGTPRPQGQALDLGAHERLD